jgi:hypothetical protein
VELPVAVLCLFVARRFTSPLTTHQKGASR